MDEKLLHMLNGREDIYPKKLEQQYPRVLSRIIELWHAPEIDGHLLELLVDMGLCIGPHSTVTAMW